MSTPRHSSPGRRDFIRIASAAGFAALGPIPAFAASTRREVGEPGRGLAQGQRQGAGEEEGFAEEEEVSPSEDLMREHGVLKRILLVYEEAKRRLDARQDFSPDDLLDAARMVRDFVEDYHEKLEENHLFPRFRAAGQQLELVRILIEQHQGGRRLTDVVLRLARQPALRNDDDRRQLGDALHQFVRMYEPHEAREDTVLFPAFRRLVSKNEYDALGESFEREEHRLFGEDGFASMVERVARIEREFGIFDLSQFTPKLP